MSINSTMRYGFAVPIFANPGIVDVRTPSFHQLDWEPIRQATMEAEQLGYDSLWVADHMFLGRDGAILESWTTLSYLAALTTRMRLGNIHLGNGFRPPALTAKMAATLDYISGGRFDMFIDPGWREREHRAYDLPWDNDRAVRIDQAAEAIALSRELWTGNSTSFHGNHYQLNGAISTPRPTTPAGPDIWIGEALDDATLSLVAREADVWNSMPAGLDVLREKIEQVDNACRRRGRDPQTLRKSLETQVLIVDSDQEWNQWLETWNGLAAEFPPGSAMDDFFTFVQSTNERLNPASDPDRFKEEFIIGTASEVADKIHAYEELGISEIIFWFMDFPDGTTMRRLAREVRPRVEERA